MRAPPRMPEEAHVKRTTFEVLLDTTPDDQPGLSERWHQLDADEKVHALISNRSTDETIKTNAQARLNEIREQRETLEAEIAAAARIVTVDRVGPRTWGRIVSENPARPGDPYDARMGFNTDTFDRALMPAAVASVTDGHGTPQEWEWDTLVDAMTPGQYEQVMSDVLRMHMEREAVPFSLTDYRSRHG